MKRKLYFSVTLILCALFAFSQTTKVPIKTPSPGVKPLKMTAIAIGPTGSKYSSDNGHVDISYSRSKPSKDDISTTSTPSKAAMCLTREEVKGQKIENELVIADGSLALEILPGGVIDAGVLLQSGQFKYMKMDGRKKISISTTSNLAKKTSEEVIPGNNNNNIEEELRTKVHSLTRPSNLNGMPNVKSQTDASISTLEEKTGLNIGASFFYMGASVNNNFRFSSSKYHYMYMYQFEQECLPVIANGISSPADLFKETTSMNDNWLYIREVKYGRRLFVLIESEYDLEKYSDELDGNLSWGVVSAKLSVDVKHSSLSKQTNVRIITQGGQPVGNVDVTRLQATLDNYFKTPFKDFDIVPLAYKLTYMDGGPVSIVSNAFLDGKNCLDNDKIKVRISKIECTRVDDNKNNEEIYGTASIFLYSTDGKVLFSDGKTPNPSSPSFKLPTGSFGFGTKDAPIILSPQKPKEYPEDQQGKYAEMYISSLDMPIEILPYVHEKDNGFNADDDYITEDRMKKTLRQMLMEASTAPVFEFRRKNSVLKVYFEIIPN